LARVGDHLRVYSEQKDRLAAELRVAEDRSRHLDEGSERVERLASIVRDLSLLEGPAIHAGALVVGSNGRDPVLRAPAVALAAGAELSADAKRIVKALGRVAELHPYAKFVISGGGAAASNPTLLRTLSEALIAEGVASERVAVAMPEAPAAPEAETPELADATAPAAEAEVVFVIQVAEAKPATSANEPSEG